LILSAPVAAHAHLTMDEPEPRYPSTEQKDGPCGRDGGERTDSVTVAEPGSTITIRWNEYIDHPSHYRVAFDVDGDDDFVDPVCLENCDDRRQPAMVWADDETGNVLLDFIEDRTGGGDYEVSVTLPDVECERCTLQLIQVMYDKRPYVSGGNDIYYQCADFALRRSTTETDAGPPAPEVDAGGIVLPPLDAGTTPARDAGRTTPTVDAGSDETGGGGCSTGGPGPGALWLLALLAWRRRRT